MMMRRSISAAVIALLLCFASASDDLLKPVSEYAHNPDLAFPAGALKVDDGFCAMFVMSLEWMPDGIATCLVWHSTTAEEDADALREAIEAAGYVLTEQQRITTSGTVLTYAMEAWSHELWVHLETSHPDGLSATIILRPDL